MKKQILGISAFYHDAAAALLCDGQIVAAAQEERFTRKKHTPDFPVHAIRYCLEESGLSLDELDAVVFYDKPLLKFERLLETYYAFSPRGLRQFIVSIPVWLREKMFLKKLIYNGLSELGHFKRGKLRLLFAEHHLSHAASAFYPSPYQEAAILTVDGVGEWATSTICLGKDHRIKLIKEMKFPHSVGLLYSAFTYYLGFRVNSGEYKLMGLAPYGNPQASETQRFIELIKRELVKIQEDGSIWLNQKYFNYATGLTMVKDRMWEQLLGLAALKADGKQEQPHCNLAYAIQKVTEEIVLKMAKEAKRVTGCNNLCMAGGVALNCVANGKLLKQDLFDGIYIQPAAGDAGGALGAAQLAYHTYFDVPRAATRGLDGMHGSYLGPEYSDKEAITAFRKHKAVFKSFDSFNGLCETVASLLGDGNVVVGFRGGWSSARARWATEAYWPIHGMERCRRN